MTGNTDLERRAEQLIRAFSGQATQHPMGCTQLMVALDFMVGPSQEVVIAGDPALDTTQAMMNIIQRSFLPNKVLLLRVHGSEGKRLASLAPFVAAMGPMSGRPTVYVCQGYACKTPIGDIDTLKATLNQ